MINAAFVSQASQAQNIRQKLQKLEGFTGMNTSQLLEVAIKVFVSRDQEADRKMKRKVDFLLLIEPNSWVGPSVQVMAEEEAIPTDSGQCSQNSLTLERN
jgi:hypothetical protein